jgi:hypothetical protein
MQYSETCRLRPSIHPLHAEIQDKCATHDDCRFMHGRKDDSRATKMRLTQINKLHRWVYR